MTGPEPIVINQWWFVAIVAIAFAYLGARRGLGIEVFVLAGVAVGILLADWLAQFLTPWINTVYQLVMAIVRERVSSPEKAFAVLSKQPKFITTAYHLKLLGSVLFVVLVVVGFLIGRKRSAKAKPPRLTTRVLAALVGGVNGYLIAYFLFPRHIMAAKTVIEMPTAPVRELLQVQVGVPILIVILVAITMGVLGTRQGKPRGK